MDWIMGMIVQYPKVAAVLVVMGGFRSVFKPLGEAVRAFVAATPTPKDNELLAKVEKSKAYKAMAFVVDWLTSIKLPK